MQKKWISRKEAAEMLGVHPQSISNYANKGIIHERKRKAHAFYPLEEIEALAQCPGLKDTDTILQEMDQYQREIEEKYTLTRKDYENRKHEFLTFFGGVEQWQRYRQLVETLADVCMGESYTDREKGIIYYTLSCTPIGEIANRYGLSRERVRQIFQKVLRKMVKYPTDMERRIDELKAERDKLQTKNDMLLLENNNLRTTIKNPVAMMSEDDYAAVAASNEIYRICDPYTRKIDDLGLSVRAANCLRAAEIKTIGDLVSFKKTELMRMRNFGRKSLREIDLLLERLKLDYGMWEDPKRNPDNY